MPEGGPAPDVPTPGGVEEGAAAPAGEPPGEAPPSAADGTGSGGGEEERGSGATSTSATTGRRSRQETLGAADDDVEVLAEGPLMKKSPSMISSWQPRYFSLTAAGLAYGKVELGKDADGNPAEHEWLGFIAAATMQTVSLKGRGLRLSAFCNKWNRMRTYDLRAEDEAEAARWESALAALLPEVYKEVAAERDKAALRRGRSARASMVGGMTGVEEHLSDDDDDCDAIPPPGEEHAPIPPPSFERVETKKGKRLSVVGEGVVQQEKAAAWMSLVPNSVRKMVSRKKNRYVADGFNLDLSYITPHVIAMGFPSTGLEGAYRNPMPEVQRFLTTRHSRSFRVYNLCEERKYDPAKFGGRVVRYRFCDHNAPALALLPVACADMHAFLAGGGGVAAVHCKAGKGRTGLLISCYLMHAGAVEEPEDAMEYYGSRRTANGKGVTIPSQRRYVHYYRRLLDMPRCDLARPLELVLTGLRMSGVPAMDALGGCSPHIVVQRQEYCPGEPNRYEQLYDSREVVKPQRIASKAGADGEVELMGRLVGVPMSGDVCVEVWTDGDLMFQFWVHTNFVPITGPLRLEKFELDKACSDRRHAIFPPDFAVEADFSLPGDMRLSHRRGATASGGRDPALSVVDMQDDAALLPERMELGER